MTHGLGIGQIEVTGRKDSRKPVFISMLARLLPIEFVLVSFFFLLALRDFSHASLTLSSNDGEGIMPMF
jgi:hypothetical protein